jgi:hypothetical protein
VFPDAGLNVQRGADHRALLDVARVDTRPAADWFTTWTKPAELSSPRTSRRARTAGAARSNTTPEIPKYFEPTGLPLGAFLIRIEKLRRGHIDHAINIEFFDPDHSP